MNALVAGFLVTISSMAASNETPIWNSDYGVALEATKAADQPLLVLIDKPADMGADSGEAVLHPSGELQQLLADYTLCYVDANSEYGRRVADVFRAEQFPFAAVIDSDGRKILSKWTGTRTSDQWIETLGGPSRSDDLVYRGQEDQPTDFRQIYRRDRGSRTCYT